MAKKIKKMSKKFIAFVCMITLVFSCSTIGVNESKSAVLTSMSDAMTDSRTSDGSGSVLSDHLIYFVTSASGVTATDKIKVTFPSDFDLTFQTVAFADMDLAENSGSDCAAGSWTEEDLAGAPATTTWGATVSGQTVIFESATGTIAANVCVRIKIGDNTSHGAVGTNQIENPTTIGTKNITLAVTDTGDSDIDTGTIQIAILAGVAVTATVNQAMTFTINDSAVGFGGIDSGTLRYANAGATGDTSAPAGVGDPFRLIYTSNVAGGSISVKSLNANSSAGLWSPTQSSELEAISANTINASADGFAIYGASSEMAFVNSNFGGAAATATISDTSSLFADSSDIGINHVEVDLIASAAASTAAATDYATTLIFIATPVY